MGTTWSATIADPTLDAEARAQASQAIQAALDAVNDAMSTWSPESELSRFNRHASMELFALGPATREVMAISREVSEATGGAFDVTVRPLVAAWGFGADARIPGEGPDAAELSEIADRVGWEKLMLFEDGARKAHPSLEVDLSAVAKGFGVDRAADALMALGYRDFLLEVGGEVRAEGDRPDGGAWKLAVEKPEPDGRAVFAVVELHGLAMATSGDYRSFYEAGGERVTHIVDPRTGRPVRHGLASVSVVHPSAAQADAWATALTVLGPEEGFRLAEARGLGAYFIERTPEGRYEARATRSFPPTQARGDEAP